MRLGAENRRKTIAAVLLLVLALFLLIRTLWTPGSDAVAAPAATVAAKPGPKPRARNEARRYIAAAYAPSLDPRLRLDLLKGSEGLKYEGSGRNIFREHLEDIPKPAGPGILKEVKKQWQPPAPSQPPPINLKFYGWASQPGEPKAVFLSLGDDIFIAHEGQIVGRRYKVVRIMPNSVEIEDVLSNNKQSIPLTQG